MWSLGKCNIAPFTPPVPIQTRFICFGNRICGQFVRASYTLNNGWAKIGQNNRKKSYVRFWPTFIPVLRNKTNLTSAPGSGLSRSGWTGAFHQRIFIFKLVARDSKALFPPIFLLLLFQFPNEIRYWPTDQYIIFLQGLCNPSKSCQTPTCYLLYIFHSFQKPSFSKRGRRKKSCENLFLSRSFDQKK